MTAATANPDAVAFFYEHAGYSYDPVCESTEQGRERSARELAATEAAYRADPDVFTVWQVDDIDSSSFDTETSGSEPHQLYCALLCVDCDYPGADLVRGYDPRDGIFERPGRIVGSLGGIDFGPDGNPLTDPYSRVIEAELYGEFQAQRESVLVRGEN